MINCHASVRLWLHYLEECKQNDLVEGLQPQGSSSYSKKHTRLNDAQGWSGFSRRSSGQRKKKVVHLSRHPTSETSSSLEPNRCKSGKHLQKKNSFMRTLLIRSKILIYPHICWTPAYSEITLPPKWPWIIMISLQIPKNMYKIYATV